MKIIAIGRNYSEHAKELNNPIPTEPVIFTKPDTALLKDNKPFYLPSFSTEIHYELELIFKISTEGKKIQEKFARKYYNEIGIGIDFTARDLQQKAKNNGLPWTLAKEFDHSAAVSEFIPIEDKVEKLNYDFYLLKNGNKVQHANSGQMIFNIDFIISYVSNFITLKKGDIIFTGTPSGVGPVAIGDKLEGYLNNKKLLDFDIK